MADRTGRAGNQPADGKRVAAPFTPEQVDSLNAYQASGAFHEFTCGNDLCPNDLCPGDSGEHAVLVATADGWQCPACPYTQGWAHAWMADMSWALNAVSVTVDGRTVRGEIGWLPEDDGE